MNEEKKGLLAVIAGDTIFGFSFLFSRLALETASPTVLIATRFTVAFLVLNLIVLVGTRVKGTQGKPLITFSLRGKPVKPILKLAICQPVVYFMAESYGLKMTSSSFVGIMIALIPLAGVLADMLLLHSKITKKQVLCALASVIGVILTTVGAADMHSSLLGLLILLIAVVSGALFYVFSGDAGQYYSPLERTYVMFGIGSAAYLLLAVLQSGGNLKAAFGPSFVSPVFWTAVLYLAVISSNAAFLLLNYSSSRISVSKATLTANLTTVISVLAGVLILKESFTPFQAVGSVVILISVYLAK